LWERNRQGFSCYNTCTPLCHFVPQKVKKTPFSPVKPGSFCLRQLREKTLHASSLNALIPAHKGSSFAEKSRYIFYFYTDLGRAQWTLIYITLIFFLQMSLRSCFPSMCFTRLLIFVLTAFLIVTLTLIP